jgi:CxxC motif-containing protein (DUF1111 family)
MSCGNGYHRVLRGIAVLASCFLVLRPPSVGAQRAGSNRDGTKAPDAPAAFDNQTNNFTEQAQFERDKNKFQEVEKIEDGLGPVYNATSCVSCHQNPVTGSTSQISEIRAGHFGPDPYPDPKQPAHPERIAFIEHPGGSLVHQRAIDAAIQETVLPEDTNRTLRMSTNTLGNGFVECIPDIGQGELRGLLDTINDQVTDQFGDLRGTAVLAPVSNSVDSSQERVGRFGWKAQHASLLDFSADAYLNEMGITNPLQPNENTSNGMPVGNFDNVPDPEDKTTPDPEVPNDTQHPFGRDVEAFTRFMRSTKAPPRSGSASQADEKAGEALFRDNNKTGCAICHVPDWTTLPAEAVLPGNFLQNKVGPSLGNKTIHPFSDFLLHDVGTGDGIVQTQHAQFPSRSAMKRDNVKILSVPADLFKAKPLDGHVIHLLTKDKITNIDPNRRALGGDLVDTARMIRTAPLWGLRVRPQLLHDGSALTIKEAILKHSGQAEKVKITFRDVLTQRERDQLIAFLKSL